MFYWLNWPYKTKNWFKIFLVETFWGPLQLQPTRRCESISCSVLSSGTPGVERDGREAQQSQNLRICLWSFQNWSKFEWERKKFVTWKAQTSSGSSTPNIEKSNYFKFEEDVHTSSEDIPMLATEAERRGKRRRRLLTGGQGPIL